MASEKPEYRLVTALPSSTAHEHHHGGHILRHSHDGGRVPHGFYGHPEDGAPAAARQDLSTSRPPHDTIERAYQAGGAAAAADAQRAMMTENAQVWRSSPHKLPADREERAAWLRGYGKVTAWWAGAGDDVQVTNS